MHREKITIDRQWLKSADKLRIDEATTDTNAKAFAGNVSGGAIRALEEAVGEIVAQAKSELAAINTPGPKYALLVCMPYYMKWRGERAVSAKPREKAARHGLFLVRGCVRCKATNEIRVAVFRVKAYRTGDGANKPGRYEYRARSDKTPSHATCKTGAEGNTHNAAEPWSCKCCKHLYCTELAHMQVDGPAYRLKAKCDKCQENKWRKRSKSSKRKGEFLDGIRKERTSYYEPIRKGMFFTDSTFTAEKEISKALIASYTRDDPSGATTTASASSEEPVARRTRARARASAGAMQGNSASEGARSNGSSPESGGAISDSDDGSTEAAFTQQIIPKITLTAAAPIRASPRRQTRGVEPPSFGRFV